MIVRVLHLINTLGRGGAERQLVNLIAASQGLPVMHSVLALQPPLSLAPELRDLGVTVGCLRPQRWHGSWKQIAQIIWTIQTWQPHVLHTWLRRSHLLGRVAAWKAGNLPVISSIQSPMYWPEPSLTTLRRDGLRGLVGKQLEQFTSRLGKTSFVGCSHDVTALHQRAINHPTQAMQTIYNSITLPRQSAHPRHPALRLINVGRLIPEKGQQFLIAAMPAVVARYPDAHLTIVGGGPLHSELQGQIEALGLEKSVTITGTHSDVPALLRQADLFVFPSISEGLPLALLEAMGHGLACIASEIPGVQEVFGNNAGYAVPPADSQALSQAIITLIDNPQLCSTLQHQGYLRICEAFNIEVSKYDWLNLYQRLSDGSNSP